ncbi:metal-sulfur cluster assembly factor [bacterium]|nr:metal-sulfur cluster assembly factor [bacterium]
MDTVEIDPRKVIEFLKTVEDPEFAIDIYNLGLVYDVKVEGPNVTLLMTLTSLGCPTAPLIEDAAVAAVKLVRGVEKVTVEWTFDPPWDPDMISDEGKEILESYGY